MKTNNVFLIFLMMMLGGCSTQYYLPAIEKVNVSEFGSYISITTANGQHIRGELIAAGVAEIVVLEKNTRKCLAIDSKDVLRFRIRYAKAVHYGWYIPAFTMFTILHGWYSVFTAPVNLLTTIIITLTGEIDYTLNQNSVSLSEAAMFARFPQGIPEGVHIADIQ